MKQTLCWTCLRATNKPGLGCSWSRQDGMPVKGWNARPTTINCHDNSGWNGGSYHVKECPLYLADGKKDETGCRVYVQQGEEKLTVREMAEKAGISEFTVRKRIKRGIYETASV